jgi:hypothetical protein
MKKRTPFSFARYGDGEWLTIMGFLGMRNSNGCTFTRELRDGLLGVLRDANPYYHAILRVALGSKRAIDEEGNLHVFKGRQKIAEFLKEVDCKIEWIGGDVFLERSLKGQLFPLIKQIRERRVLYVGNRQLRGLNMKGKRFFPYVSYIPVPPQNSITAREEIVMQVLRDIQSYNIDFVGWSAGLATKVMINDVYNETGGEITQVDFGSMFDGYFGPLPHLKDQRGSRSYIRKGNYDWEALRQVNTGERKKEEGETFKNG